MMQQPVTAVDANGNPVQVVVVPQGGMVGQPMVGQPMVAGPGAVATTTVVQGQPMGTSGQPGTITTVVQQPVVVDDPTCLYVLAFFGFFIWLVGAIGMCAYNCGNGM